VLVTATVRRGERTLEVVTGPRRSRARWIVGDDLHELEPGEA